MRSVEETALVSELTICSVVYQHSWHLDLNYEMTRALNPGVPLRWIRVTNTPAIAASAPTTIEAGVFREVEGADSSDVPRGTERCHSYHHALGLQLGVAEASTRYLLITDPDVYIVQKDWIARVLSHMEENRLRLFGIPHHGRYLYKYRRFPSIWGMFLDTTAIPPRS